LIINYLPNKNATPQRYGISFLTDLQTKMLPRHLLLEFFDLIPLIPQDEIE
jgi:hypothetical protein